jgi:LCP family protein required for cell wall assembly
MNSFSSKKITSDSTSNNTGKTPTPAFQKSKVSKSKQQKNAHSSMIRRLIKWVPKSKKDYQQKKVPFFLLCITFLIAFGIIFKVTYTTYQYVTNFSVTDLLGMISADLEIDKDERTNILLLGAGGGDHDGADLTDTIMIASLNHNTDNISLFSFPRDLWINLPNYQSSRINKIYDNLNGVVGKEQALNILTENIERISNLEIPYTIKVDFAGFTKIIDTLGGIDVLVEKSIFDTAYPTEDRRYETFSIEAGEQHLDGETALKYARSRHSTSDFDRAERQQKILNAIKQKAQDTNFLSSPLLLKKLYEDFSDHIQTDMSIMELIALAQFAEDFDREQITTAVLKDQDILDVGSFLYTPERELYGGAFVLVPVGNTYEKIQEYIEIVFNWPGFFKEESTFQILNGTKTSGLAAKIGQEMIPYGFTVMKYANADRKDYTQTHYYIHKPENTRVTEEVVKSFFPNAIKMTGEPPEEIDTDFDISIVVGEDAIEE